MPLLLGRGHTQYTYTYISKYLHNQNHQCYPCLQGCKKNTRILPNKNPDSFDPVQAAFDDLWHSLASFRRAKQSVAAVDAHLKTSNCRIFTLKDGWTNTSNMGGGEGKHSASFELPGFYMFLWTSLKGHTLIHIELGWGEASDASKNT